MVEPQSHHQPQATLGYNNLEKFPGFLTVTAYWLSCREESWGDLLTCGAVRQKPVDTSYVR